MNKKKKTNANWIGKYYNMLFRKFGKEKADNIISKYK